MTAPARSEVVCTNIVYVFFLSFTAYMCDLWSQKIPNALIMMGYATGFVYIIYEKGPPGIPEAVISLAWPILLLIVLYRMRALGAGDIKLLSVISVFLDFHQMLTVIYLSFLTGAVVGLVRLLLHGEMVAHLKNIHLYLYTVITEKSLPVYRGRNDRYGVLHFAGCIFAAVSVMIIWEVLLGDGTI